MPDRRNPLADDPEVDALVRATADRAAQIALAGAEDRQKLAVDRAVRDVNVDRDLREHDRHLARINGSQEKFAASLGKVENGVQRLAEQGAKQLAVSTALAEQGAARESGRLSRRTLWIAGVTGMAGYGTIIAMILTQN